MGGNTQRPKKTAVAPAVIAVVKAWAAARPDDAARVLRDGRLALDPLLLPVLVDEVAEITAEQLLIALDLPHTPPKGEQGEKPVPFLGLELSQEQGKRTALWLDEQRGIAEALGLTPESWSTKLGDGFARTLATLRGRPLGEAATTIGQQLATDPLKTAAAGFAGGVDPAKSDKAGLRGILAARSFKGRDR